MKRKLISQSAVLKANKLHNDEHIIIQRKEADHKAEYYYYMASQLVEDLRKEIKELSKQTKYLWQTMEEKLGKELSE